MGGRTLLTQQWHTEKTKRRRQDTSCPTRTSTERAPLSRRALWHRAVERRRRGQEEFRLAKSSSRDQEERLRRCMQAADASSGSAPGNGSRIASKVMDQLAREPI